MFTRNGIPDGFVGITRQHVTCTIYLNNIQHIDKYCFKYFDSIHFEMYLRINLKLGNKFVQYFIEA